MRLAGLKAGVPLFASSFLHFLPRPVLDPQSWNACEFYHVATGRAGRCPGDSLISRRGRSSTTSPCRRAPADTRTRRKFARFYLAPGIDRCFGLSRAF